jgi:peptidoglycan/xylan/chitin deacetylase (PgdA/CDA1 family)
MRLFAIFLLLITTLFSYSAWAAENRNIPILCYHNFNPTKPGSMNLTPQRFEMQIQWLKDNGFTIIPLQQAVDYLQGKSVNLPAKPIVITDDDGWKSVYTYMLPIVKKYNIPVTLFIYPGTISEGKNALTWEELKALQATGLFDIQGHTYSHPNFKHAKKAMSPANYAKFVTKELVTSKQILEEKMGKKITLLAWPFGIYDPYLEQAAKNAGYVMAFTIDYKAANRSFRPEAQPRFMIVASETEKFTGIANQAKTKSH